MVLLLFPLLSIGIVIPCCWHLNGIPFPCYDLLVIPFVIHCLLIYWYIWEEKCICYSVVCYSICYSLLIALHTYRYRFPSLRYRLPAVYAVTLPVVVDYTVTHVYLSLLHLHVLHTYHIAVGHHHRRYLHLPICPCHTLLTRLFTPRTTACLPSPAHVLFGRSPRGYHLPFYVCWWLPGCSWIPDRWFRLPGCGPRHTLPATPLRGCLHVCSRSSWVALLLPLLFHLNWFDYPFRWCYGGRCSVITITMGDSFGRQFTTVNSVRYLRSLPHPFTTTLLPVTPHPHHILVQFTGDCGEHDLPHLPTSTVTCGGRYHAITHPTPSVPGTVTLRFTVYLRLHHTVVLIPFIVGRWHSYRFTLFCRLVNVTFWRCSPTVTIRYLLVITGDVVEDSIRFLPIYLHSLRWPVTVWFVIRLHILVICPDSYCEFPLPHSIFAPVIPYDSCYGNFGITVPVRPFLHTLLLFIACVFIQWFDSIVDRHCIDGDTLSTVLVIDWRCYCSFSVLFNLRYGISPRFIVWRILLVLTLTVP